jgi:hypothetical protein
MKRAWARYAGFAVAIPVVLITGASTAGAISIPLPVEHLVIAGELTPTRISATRWTPVTLEVSETLSTEDGSHLKPPKEVTFEFDRHFRLDFDDVPSCPFSRTQDLQPDWEKCSRARIGGGTVKWEIAFPDGEPFRAGGRALLYKSGSDSMILRGWVSLSPLAEVLIPIELGKTKGVYDLTATASIPKLAGGYGSLSHLRLRFRKGLLSATCPRGRLQLSVLTRFLDGALFKGSLFRPCDHRKRAVAEADLRQ